MRSNGFINYLALRMPLGIMVVLVAATLPAALAATVGLHLLKSNAVPSVLGGTAVHVGILSWPL